MKSKHSFSEVEKAAVYKAMEQRRDMRHFTSEPVDASVLNKILYAANLAPSVGLMQPWRFIRITDLALRKKLHALVEHERIQTANALGEREEEFCKLKVEGILECSDVIVAALPDKREQHIFGRRTMPEMDFASLSCAIQNMWLAARVEGIGMGWVSMFEPEHLADILNMPKGSQPIAILCLGHVEAFYKKPMLEEENWTEGTSLDGKIFDNYWPE